MQGSQKAIKKSVSKSQKKDKEQLNDIFTQLKGPNKKPKVEGPIKQEPKKQSKQVKKATAVRKVTEEGYKVYNEKELNLGKGGDTELCPFDCECCF